MADGSDESGASALYGLPLDEFTRARDELARERRAAGDRSGAAAIKALRKPSVPAWALNQVARNDPALVAALRSAGDQVRSASDRALAGDASELRDATRTLADRAAALADDAAEALAAAGRPPTPATYDRIMATVRAADTVFRFGGDEFVVLLPRTGLLPAQALVSRISARLRDETYHWAGAEQRVPRVSFGIAWFPEDGRTADALLAVADERMYDDKSRARDERRGAAEAD